MTVNEAIDALRALSDQGHGEKTLIEVNDSMMDLPVDGFELCTWDDNSVVISAG